MAPISFGVQVFCHWSDPVKVKLDGGVSVTPWFRVKFLRPPPTWQRSGGSLHSLHFGGGESLFDTRTLVCIVLEFNLCRGLSVFGVPFISCSSAAIVHVLVPGLLAATKQLHKASPNPPQPPQQGTPRLGVGDYVSDMHPQ